MGYASYTLSDGRQAGYGIDATCDELGCDAEIHRGIDYLCGDQPDGDHGCGRYFCYDHLFLGAPWSGSVCRACSDAESV